MSAPAPTLSAIVPAHFGGAGLGRCVAALRAGVPPPDEIVVVADGETDGAWRGLDGPDLRVIERPHAGGPAAARNAGARAARGDVLFFVDADVVVRRDTVARVRRAFEDDPALTALIGSYDDTPGDGGFLSQYRNLLHHYTHQTAHDEARTFWGACGAVRQTAFHAVGGFDEAYREPSVEDIELGYRLVRAGYRIRLLKDLQVSHLKRWTAGRMLRTDVLARAAPWTELLLDAGTVENNLNVDLRGRLSLGALAVGGAAVLVGPWAPLPALVAGGLAAALFGALNAPFYFFLHRKRGVLFALKAVPWHVLYYACGGLGLVVGAARYAHRRLSPASSAGAPAGLSAAPGTAPRAHG